LWAQYKLLALFVLINTLRNVEDYYVSCNSTPNVCFLVKAFDNLNHSVIFIQLMKRNVPAPLVKLLSYWYSISYNTVRWDDVLFQPYKLVSGVRQVAGVLSSVIFLFM